MPVSITSDLPSIRALTVGLKTVFNEQYVASMAQGVRNEIATEVPSSAESEDYAWLGGVPGVREWLGERQFKDISGYSYTLKNKRWENSIEVPRPDLERDRYGLIKTRIQDLAVRAAQYQDQLVMETLAAGFASLCFDGQYFFDTDHASGSSGTQSNKGTSALSVSSLLAARLAMMKFKDDTGRVMGIVPDTLVVPPDLLDTAEEISISEYAVYTETDKTDMRKNILKGKFRVIGSAYLTDTNDWFLLATKGIMKPLIFQLEKPVELESLQEGSDVTFLRDAYQFGTNARYNAGYGLWQLAYGASVT